MTIALLALCGVASLAFLCWGLYLAAWVQTPWALLAIVTAFTLSVPMGFLACDLDPHCACLAVTVH